jgi:hypothetical protein
MSERALAFVVEWISQNVTAADAAGDAQARAKALASRCLADAGAKGITASEIGDAIDDLPAFIGGAIKEAGERDTHGKEFETDQEIELLVDPDKFDNAAEDAAEDNEK